MSSLHLRHCLLILDYTTELYCRSRINNSDLDLTIWTYGNFRFLKFTKQLLIKKGLPF